MAFISTTKFLLPFDTSALVERVSGDPMSIIGTDTIIDILDRSLGYSMKAGQHLEKRNVSIATSVQLSCGFWLKSINPGMARNPINDEVESLQMAVFDMRDTTNNSVLLCYELTEKNEQNRLRFSIHGTDGNVVTATTDKYNIGTWQHFWITYDGTEPAIRLFINGAQASLTTTGTVPVSINGSVNHVSINRQALGASFNVADNQGDIDDLVILNTEDFSDAVLQKIMNHSLEFAFDTTYMDNEEVEQAFLFNDPNVFRLTAVDHDSSEIFASRSDGKILVGSSAMWDVRRRFINADEIEDLDILGSGFNIDGGFLEINGIATIKL